MNIEKEFKIIRWMVLVPLVIILSVIAFYLSGIIAVYSIDAFESGDLSFPASIAAFVTSIVWITTAFVFAPSYKKIILWIAFFIGSILLFICSFWLFEEDIIKEWNGILSIIASALIPSFLFCLFIQNKKINTKQKIFNTLDENNQ